MFGQLTTKSEAIANGWIAEGYHVHVACIDGPRNRYIRGTRKFTDSEQLEAQRAIEAICAELCSKAGA